MMECIFLQKKLPVLKYNENNHETEFHAAIKPRQFSLRTYLGIVLLLSWPFQFWFAFSATDSFDLFLSSSISMVMVAFATYIYGKYILRDGFASAGWRWGKPIHYVLVNLFALFLWLVPSLIELELGTQKPLQALLVGNFLTLFLFNFVRTLIPAFGEEFGWRGYLLPHLARNMSARKALLLHAFIWWFWHLPVIISMGFQSTDFDGSPLYRVIQMMTISILPSMFHAIIFAFIWVKTKSLAVVMVYHAAFDEVRDTLQNFLGLDVKIQIWQMSAIIIAGSLLLWRADWNKLLMKSARIQNKKAAHFDDSL